MTTNTDPKQLNTKLSANNASVSRGHEKRRSRVNLSGKRFRPGLFLVLLVFAGIGSALLIATRAAGPVNIYVSPSSGTFTVNSTFTSIYRINTNSGSASLVSLRGTYPTDKLQCTGITLNTTDFPLSPGTPQCTGGNIIADVATNVGAPAVTGDKAVATVTFKALSAGAAPVTVLLASEAYGPGSDDGSGNVTNTRTGANYTITNPAPTITSFTATSPVVTGSTTSFNWTTSNTSGSTPCSIASVSGLTGHSYPGLGASGPKVSNTLVNSTGSDINAVFRLTCNGAGGTTAATSNVTVVVKPTPKTADFNTDGVVCAADYFLFTSFYNAANPNLSDPRVLRLALPTTTYTGADLFTFMNQWTTDYTAGLCG